MVRIGEAILFTKGEEEKQGIVTNIEQRKEDSRYELLVKDVLGDCVVLLEGDDTFLVLK